MKTIEIVLAIIAMSAATFTTRVAAFILPRKWSESDLAIKASVFLPNAILSLLVIYSVKDLNLNSKHDVSQNLITILTVAVIQYWTRNTLLSVFSGTAFYMFLIQVQLLR